MTELVAEVLSGPGTVSRSGTVGLWLGSDVTESLARSLLTAMGRPLDEVKGILTAEAPDTLGSLAVVSVEGSSVGAVLHGQVVMQNARGEAHCGSFTSQVLRVDLPMDGLVAIWGIGTPLDRSPALPRDLREGIVPGGGLVLRAAPEPDAEEPAQPGLPVVASPSTPVGPPEPEPVGPPEPEPRPPVAESPSEPVRVEAGGDDRPPTDGDSIKLLDLAEPPPVRDPLPVGPPPSQAEHSGQTVQGVMCVNGHFNHPDAFYCRVCGIGMTQLTKVLVDGPRPTLGVVVAGNGATYTVDRDYVIGRQPDPGDGPVIVVNDERVSRRHGQLTRSGWELVVTDLNSANGTYVKNVGWHDWVRVMPGHGVVVEPRGQIGLGGQIMVFESSVRPSKV